MKRNYENTEISAPIKRTRIDNVPPCPFLALLSEFFPNVLAQLVAQYNERVCLPRNVRFSQGDDSVEINAGLIGVESFDRVGWCDPFVVIRNQARVPVGKVLDVIFPRIYFAQKGDVKFGVDQLHEKFGDQVECTCYWGTGCDHCSCGASQENTRRYRLTFTSVGSNYLYEVQTLSEGYYMTFDFPSKSRLKESDCW